MFDHLEADHKVVGVVAKGRQRRKVHTYEFPRRKSFLEFVNSFFDLVYGSKTLNTPQQSGYASPLAATNLENIAANVISGHNIRFEQPLMDRVVRRNCFAGDLGGV